MYIKPISSQIGFYFYKDTDNKTYRIEETNLHFNYIIMYWEFEKIWDNKYSYSMNEPEFYAEFEYNPETWCWETPTFDVKQKLIEDTFDMDFQEYFLTNK